MSVRRAIELAALGVSGVVVAGLAVWAPERLPKVVVTVLVMFVVTEAALAWWLPGSGDEAEDEPADTPDPP